MTIRTDIFGCPVSISPNGDLEAWNNTQLDFLSHAATTPDNLAKCIASDADFALPLICQGLFSLLLARRELCDVAKHAERDARAAIRRRPITSREEVFLDALSDYNLGYAKDAADRLDLLAKSDPHDALAMKLVHSIRFLKGDAIGMRSSIEGILPHMDEDHPAYGYALGCHAFSLEETGEFALAEKIGRNSVAITPNNAWGLHAVAPCL